MRTSREIEGTRALGPLVAVALAVASGSTSPTCSSASAVTGPTTSTTTGCTWRSWSRRAASASRRAIAIEKSRLGWALIGRGLLSFAAGDLYWTEVLSERSGEVTFPSVADIGYLAYFPLASPAPS